MKKHVASLPVRCSPKLTLLSPRRDPISAHLTLHDATSSTPLRALGVIRLTPYPIPPCPTSSTWPLDSTQLPAAELAKSFAAAGGAKISRVAVRPELRGKGGGAKLMLEAEKYIREAVGGVEGESAKGVKVVLSSQLIAVKFYDRLGYKPEGDVYDEEGQPHIVSCASVKGRGSWCAI